MLFFACLVCLPTVVVVVVVDGDHMHPLKLLECCGQGILEKSRVISSCRGNTKNLERQLHSPTAVTNADPPAIDGPAFSSGEELRQGVR